MVEIREESSETHDGAQPSSSSSSSSRAQSASSGSTMSISQFVTSNNIECLLNGARLLTIIFALSYLFPFLSPVAPDSAYYKAFAAAAATSAIRLHQRIGGFSFSRQFLATLLIEDSCHYLFYSILFLTSSPITMALLPIGLYAALHFANFLVKFLFAIGKGQTAFCSKIQSVVSAQTSNILGVIACGEIFLIPLLISMIFVGRATLLIPFVYYRFLTLRYASRRNPYTRMAFAQMKESLNQISYSPNCPAIVRNLIDTSVNFISRLAPAM